MNPKLSCNPTKPLVWIPTSLKYIDIVEPKGLTVDEAVEEFKDLQTIMGLPNINAELVHKDGVVTIQITMKA